MYENVDRAIESLRRGEFILIYDFDNREGETDFVIASGRVTDSAIRTMRKDGGGLICTCVPYSFWKKIDMPYMVDIYRSIWDRYPLLKYMEANDIPYDAKSSFSITINHRKSFTGITDRDRALTISEFARVIEYAGTHEQNEILSLLEKNFRTPGHVSLLNGSNDLLNQRRGHTELSLFMMYAAGLLPSSTICEMMGDDGYSLSKKEAMKYAEEHNIPYLTGNEILMYKERLKSANITV
ncbi:MAG: 3,4-dihydroxy-2-butanone-4-phosphate synthase [Candidatus Thermoplasmatota archaeon]|jgi:3,4-dihydroxy 2-butanone 4-phosphate synthase|nr:3,4-dihydroxy-2-butanone-4-phosphate synthase [Candidatus Thermoplasmatota archaeon]MCL5963471.1 3,4-dihydroxy-2-butanone-4-phosphate synthase [Candidatus Thermoplasmatota archaeon]